jgi:hypothetical protein
MIIHLCWIIALAVTLVSLTVIYDSRSFCRNDINLSSEGDAIQFVIKDMKNNSPNFTDGFESDVMSSYLGGKITYKQSVHGTGQWKVDRKEGIYHVKFIIVGQPVSADYVFDKNGCNKEIEILR